jgi:DNA-binding SARP family transcriptional activator
MNAPDPHQKHSASREQAATEILSLLQDNYRETRERISALEESLARTQELLERWAAASGGEVLPLPPPSSQRGPALMRPQVSAAPPAPSPSSPSLLIYCFGRFRAVLDGQPLHGSRKNKSDGILKLLLVHLGGSLPKDALIETFWPGSNASTGDASFRVAMHNLRRKLAGLGGGQGRQPILFQGGNYSLDPQAPLTVDFQEFERHWEAGRLLESSGRELEAIGEYRQAEAWYGGDFLEEDLYEEWAIVKRESLRDIYLTILGKIADFYLRVGDYSSCIESSRKLLERDPCREDAYQYLMLCYGKLGDRTRALRWYDLCRETMRKQLGQPVSPETEALHQRIARGGVL